MGRWRPVIIFLAALAVRLVYIFQIRNVIYFDVPLVDGANYLRTAMTIVSGDLAGGTQPFWQPPLYPYFLAGLIALFGPVWGLIYVIQAGIGAASCLMVYFIGRRLFGERAGIWASVLMILYAPLVHFDAQPLIPVLHIALTLLGLLFMLRAAGVPAPCDTPRRDWCLGGLSWGFSAIATPNILLAVPAAAVWCYRRARPARAPLLLLLVGVAAPVGLVTLRNAVVAREFVLISSNGGINFFIGNNADYNRTVQIRPGGEFERLVQEPENLGLLGAGRRSKYFTHRALAFLGQYPGQAARLYLRKGFDLIAGREIPRNQEIYVYRGHSSLLAILLWRFGVSFPFGVVAPLALAGLLVGARRAGGGLDGGVGDAERADEPARRSGRILVLLFAASYAVSILIFFPTDRYRLPLVPVACLLAGSLLGAGRAVWRRPVTVAAILGGLVLFNLDAMRPSESWPEEEALNRAYALRTRGNLDAAKEEYHRAMALDPERIDPINALAVMAAGTGDWEEAARRYAAILEIAPDFVEVRRNLGLAYRMLGREEEARREWEIAIHFAPGAGLALANLCLSHLDEGYARRARPYCERAVAVRPDLPETHLAMGLVARHMRERELARSELTEAVRMFPGNHPGRERAETILDRMRLRDLEEGRVDGGS